MPYLNEGVRSSLKEGRVPGEAGELNYLITCLCDAFLMRTGLSYKNINQAIGALECAKLELYARVARPYEEKKCRENGEIYVSINSL